jgi:AMP-binding enzyme
MPTLLTTTRCHPTTYLRFRIDDIRELIRFGEGFPFVSFEYLCCVLTFYHSLVPNNNMSDQTSTVVEHAAPGVIAQDNDDFILTGPTSTPLVESNLGQLLDQQRDRYSEKIVAVSRWQGQSLTYRAFHDAVRDIARSLLDHGVRPNDHVVVLAGNTMEYAQLFFAVGGIGATFAIINPTFTTEEVVAAIDFLSRMHPCSMTC